MSTIQASVSLKTLADLQLLVQEMNQHLIMQHTIRTENSTALWYDCNLMWCLLHKKTTPIGDGGLLEKHKKRLWHNRLAMFTLIQMHAADVNGFAFVCISDLIFSIKQSSGEH